MIPYTLNENGITMFYRGRQRTIASDHHKFDEIVFAVTQGNPLDDLLDVKQYIVRAAEGNVSICSDDIVRYKGNPVPDYVGKRLISHYEQEIPVAPLFAFIEKLMQNPNQQVREDLYQWLEAGKMPIWPDGDFVAYKLVRADFSPIHKGPYGQNQSPGMVVHMPREMCDEDRDHTCSSGLHFCSYEYLPTFQSWNNYQGNKVILLKINPTDVVAIPRDYNLSKGRCCGFEVVSEIDPENIRADFGNLLVMHDNHYYNSDDNEWDADYHEDDTEWEWKLEKDHGEVNYHLQDNEEPIINEVNLTYDVVVDLIEELNGNKSAAAKKLGIPRSRIYSILKHGKESKVDPLRLHAQDLVEKYGSQTQAAAHAGVSRSTIARWLAR